MVSSINLGNVVSVGNSTIASGISSGLDIAALVNAATSALSQPAVQDQTTITQNNNIINALGQLQSQLTSLMDSAESLASVTDSSGNQSNDVFDSRAGFVTSNTAVAGSTYLGITAANYSAIANYNITVGALAQAKSQNSITTFTSQTSSVTGPQGSSTPAMFSAGTFQVTGGAVTNSVTIASNDSMTGADITSTGTVGSAVLDSSFGSGGIGNFTASDAGDPAFVGSLAGAQISGGQAGGTGTPITLTFTINGSAYTSDAIDAGEGTGDQIAAGTVITFTNATTNTSFQVEVAANTTISDNADLSSFAANVSADLSSITINQAHSISAFNQAATAGTTLQGLTTANVKLSSSEYNPATGSMGTISNFIVTAATGGMSNASIQVTINGETYVASGLSGTQSSNITLTSTSSNSTLDLNIGDAGISLNLSNATAAAQVQADLNDTFGTGVNITLDQGDSLDEIASAINATQSTSGLSATVIEVSNNDYQLTLQSTQTGIENAYNINDAANNTMGGISFSTVPASDASVTINNVTITRPTNDITDAIPGLTFNLFQATPVGTTLQVQVTNDENGINTAITNFVTAYNNFKTFAAEQQQLTSTGSYASTAYLGNDNILNNVLTQIQTQLNQMIAGLSPGSENSLAAIGITFSDQAAAPASGSTPATPAVANILSIDTNTLVSAITSNPQAVQNIFDVVFNSSESDKLQVFSTTSATTATNFNVQINSSAPAGQQVQFSYLDSSGNLQTAYGNFTQNSEGGIISGEAGTPFAGLELLYAGSGNDTINSNTLTQGVADGIFNILNNLLSQNGALTTEVNSYNTQNTNLNQDIANITQQVSLTRTQLLNKYAALNSAIEQANSTLELLNVQAGILTGGNLADS